MEDARNIKASYDIGDSVNVEIQSKDFGRIATQSAKNGIYRRLEKKKERVSMKNIMKSRMILLQVQFRELTERTLA